MSRPTEYVWMTDEKVYAELINLGAYTSVVRFTDLGIEYTIVVNNDEFEQETIGEESHGQPS